ncbi:MAG: hypothetical protein JOZ80_01955 [Acidobacteriaceae bacterium]|nr:hypothetical protein [Acidobacteriaceae bacterium]
MVCRLWHGWTTLANAEEYGGYLQKELFPKVKRELEPKGYRGFQLLRSKNGAEVEFVTMLWFDSLVCVRAFAGEEYSTPVISEKAKNLLSRYADRVVHYELSSSSFPAFK